MSELADNITAMEGVTVGDAGDVAKGCQHQLRCELAALRPAAALCKQSGYHLEHITCLDLRADEGGCMRLAYQFNQQGAPDRLLLHVEIAPDAHGVTISDLFRGADWYEREVFDMHGVIIDGHADLRRLLMPEDYVGHPLLKDFTDEDPERHIMAAPMPAPEAKNEG
ncbi:MAG: NADH-quinone oxidoreductase subunit C [Gemmatimonadetes bacterium]|nr:NADH-quinone oxidoreductase subunit C [Gemmatimonadota bacterium]MBT5059400.1 NADH-quinone oxidoreductase subunit C [Gemmatimonadota bacterium]MBT5146305.1 NADH-quinone oxidoreductase subunit C [Gemmatimonadota bacterium]MBT5591228.1 NADH-quinone oxidoreductase subunit C [Gemmatimonadota bacterium]MBT5962317.1 NADH-quinone oxidoreductase subunit C [Gemmatimonadota bacterium]